MHGTRCNSASRRLAWGLAAAMLGLLLAGCAGLPPVDRQATASEGIEIDPRTKLGRIALDSTPDGDLTGVRLLPNGSYALDTRLELTRHAEVSIDLQYFQFANDATGRRLLRALRDAAARGARVRLLLDDLYTGALDPLLLAFAAHDRIEVRLFNPFCCGRSLPAAGRLLVSLPEWERVNHRMHNKLFIADGAMAVIGGRNIADEYFQRDSGENFVGLDAFVIGFVVSPLQFLFDRYWNSAAVFPLHAVVKPTADHDTLRAQFDAWTGPQTTPALPRPPANDVLGYGPIADDLDFGRLGLNWTEAIVFADHPDKPFDKTEDGELAQTSVAFNLFESIRGAREEVVISSPYFVPGPHSLAMLQELRGRGVAVTVLTNSLGSIDEPLAHIGYRRHREALLAMGVELYEISRSRLKRNERHLLFGPSLGRLHAKLVVIDRRRVFIGSMNLTPRSATINTELGSLIDSPALAREVRRVVDIDRLQSAYRLRLDAAGACCEWLGDDGEREVVLSEEPDSSAWIRFGSWLLAPFVPDEQL